MSNQISTQTFSFYGSQLVTFKLEETIYTAVRPIVDALGLSWGSQSIKLNKNKDKFNCFDIKTVAEDGKLREMLCMPIKKLNGWLFSINPDKVRSDLREKVIQYQEECFQALHDYWTKGKAERAVKEKAKILPPMKNDGTRYYHARSDYPAMTPAQIGYITGLILKLSHLRQLHPNTLYRWFFTYYGVNRVKDVNAAFYDNVVAHLENEVEKYSNGYVAPFLQPEPKVIEKVVEKIVEKPVEKIVYLPRKHPLDDFDFTQFIKALDLAAFHTEKLKKEWDELFAALKLLNYRKAYNMNERLHVANWNLQRYKPLFEKFKAAQPQLEGLNSL